MGAISTYRTEPTARRGNYHVRTLRARLDLGGVSVSASHGGATKIGCDRRRNEDGTLFDRGFSYAHDSWSNCTLLSCSFASTTPAYLIHY